MTKMMHRQRGESTQRAFNMEPGLTIWHQVRTFDAFDGPCHTTDTDLQVGAAYLTISGLLSAG